MHVLRSVTLMLFVLGALIARPVLAQPPDAPDTYYRATVEAVLDQGEEVRNEITIPFQVVRVKMLEGDRRNESIIIDHGKTFTVDKTKFVRPGQSVVVVRTLGPDSVPIYQIIDTYRLNSLWPFLLAFAAAVLLLSGWRGAGSIIGMIISLVVITGFIVPRILAGADPLLVSITGGLFIMITTIYLAHGFSRQTTIALVSTGLTLLFIGLLSLLMVKIASLTGLGSEDAYSLKLGPNANINFRGLLLGGILIGALGVLDDVTTGLTASVFELKRANPKLDMGTLFSAGLRVGREHVTSLVNTLVLAYAGASFPMFIMLTTNPNRYPLWATLNSEMLIEEIVRTLTGSLGLVIAVPLTTLLAAWHLSRKR